MKISFRIVLLFALMLSFSKNYARFGSLTLGNQVWNDYDGDGRHDPDEPGIGNATVNLYTDNNADNLPDGPAIATIQTDIYGKYTFTGLSAGKYIVSMPLLPGYTKSPNSSTQATSPYPDNNIDNDNNLVNDISNVLYTNAITLADGTEPTTDGDGDNGNLTMDLAQCGNSFIGDFVWNDLDHDGIQNANEPGINGATVMITFEDGTTATTTTLTYNGHDGYYDFKNLGPGTYKITFTTPAGFAPSPANMGTNDSLDSDPINGDVLVTIAANQSDFTIDAGFYQALTGNLRLGNQVWNDYDGDGRRDLNEPGIGNVTVSLYTDNDNNNLPDGPAIATTVTDLYGHYLFNNLVPGHYIASIPLLPGYTQSPNIATQATSPFPDNDIDNDNNLVHNVSGIMFTNAITLTAGGEPTTDGDDANGNLTLDLAECGNSFIGDFVWNDLNHNGIQDANEPGINGATIMITFEDGTTATTTTLTYNGHDGYYDFKNLGPGTYKITFTTPAGFTPSPSNVGANDSLDSDPVNGDVLVTIAANQSDFTIDAGFYQALTGNLRLGNQVWNDYDGDGKRDLNEPGIGNVTVSLYTDNDNNNLPDGPAIATTVTDLYGHYLFNNLVPGRYIASIPLLPGYTQSPNIATQATSPFPDNDIDNDNNLVHNVSGIMFTNAITLTAGGEPTTDGDDANGNLTLDLAECGNSFIGDFVWNDLNHNGIQDANEPGINGATVMITFEDGTTATTTTLTYNGHDGYYDFKNLGPGTYKITFTTPAGFTPSPSNVGANDSLDSDPINGDVLVTIAANQSDFTIDAGFYYQAIGNLRLGNQVWNDYDGDGKRDPNEPGIGNVTVSLYTDSDGDNLPDGPAIATTVTDLFGHYLFTGLTSGRYIASMPLLPGYSPSPNTTTQATSPFPDNDIDNDNNLVHLVNGQMFTNAITLSAGGEPTTDGDDADGNLTLDLAECGNSFIGDFVWNDLNSNGLQDAGESGINGVDVMITFEDGITATTTTLTYNGHDGYYDFKNLGPGTYKITFPDIPGFSPSPANVGANDSIDSDPVNGDAFVTVAANQSDFTIDAGYITGTGGLRLGNLVWNDINQNGKKDADEPGVSGAAVNLYEDNNGDNIPDGAAISSATSVNGFYGFSNLAAGKYIVGVVVPNGYSTGATTATSADPDNDTDNDNNGVNLIAGETRSNHITLSEGGEPSTDGDNADGNLTLDFGLLGGAFIGDFVFNDANADGIQQASETGIANAIVKLVFTDGTVRTTTTSATGKYGFSNLGPGSYIVQFITPAGNTPSPANRGTNDAKDSDPVNGDVAVILAANEFNNTIDAGFYKSPCTAAAGTCGPGYLTLQTSLVRNGDFSAPIISPAAGNAFVGNYTTPGIAYNFGTGSFTAQAGYSGVNVKPVNERGFSIIHTIGAFTASDSVNQLPFPGDPANSVPATEYFMYHNGNDLGGYAVIWQQTVTGMVPGKSYRFRFYVSNMIEPVAGLINPEVRVYENGTPGVADGTLVAGPVSIDETSSSNATALNGWKRIEYSFTATSVSSTFKIVSANAGIFGNDLGLTAIGLEVCEKDTDGDCVADIDDIDDDNDGILDVVENGGYDALQDCDNDGIPNYKDPTPGCITPAGNDIYGQPYQPLTWTDCNGDGINDFFDWDRDGIINELDLDSDNDGILDVQETRDPRATDNNHDGMVDGIDADGDGLLSSADINDNNPSIAASVGLIPQDLDRDGHPNYLDLDSDGDGIVDNREALELDAFAAGYTGLTMGTNDDDKDGVRTVNYTSNDNDADNYKGFGAKGIILRDNDNDGFPNAYDIDSDNDGITDNVEGQPTCSEIQPFGTDADGDGLDDAYDTDPNICTRKAPGITPYDKDEDGIPDIRDLDTDNDGAPDVNEGSGIYGDFVTNYNDTDGDGLIDQFDIFNIKTAVDSFTHNVAHSEMGPNGNFDGPVPGGSNAPLPQQKPGTCPVADRDWRDVSILPLSLVEFKGTLEQSSIVKLNWKVTQEISMSHYVIERSLNGREYTAIGKVTARGNTNTTIAYTYNDNVAGLGAITVYYRLREVEKSSAFKVSHVISFKVNDKGGTYISLYPNPASNYFVLKVKVQKEENAGIRVMDMAGRTLILQNTKLVNGANNLSINTRNLPAGTYNVQVLADGEMYNQRLVITK